MMESYIADILRISLLIMAGMGTLIAILLIAIIGVAKWSGVQILNRMTAQELTMTQIRDLLTDKFHTHDVRIVRLEERVESHLRDSHPDI